MGKSQMQVLVLVGSAGTDPWLTIEEKGQKPWIAKHSSNGIRTIWMEGNERLNRRLSVLIFEKVFRTLILAFSVQIPAVRWARQTLWYRQLGLSKLGMLRKLLDKGVEKYSYVNSDRVRLHLPTAYYLSGIRTIANFKWVLQHIDFDYLLRITSTSTFNPPALSEFLKTLPTERVFAGKRNAVIGSQFLGGSALLFSRDVVEAIIHNLDDFRLDALEDVALGRLVENLNLAEWFDLPWVGVSTIRQAEETDSNQISSAVVIRCKTNLTGWTTDSDSVIGVMRSIHDRLDIME